MEEFIFVYGSLVNKNSRRIDIIENNEIIFKGYIKNYKRGWYVNVKERHFTSLGIVKSTDSICNGLFIKVSDRSIKNLDKREIEGSYGRYKKIIVESDNISLKNKDIKVYTYIAKNYSVPNRASPIIQSYVDTVLMGYLSISEKYAIDFLLNTYEWNKKYWINDRNNPLYKNYSKIDYKKIDKLLNKCNLI